MREIGGQPLVKWTLDAALDSQAISKIVVSTDWTEVSELAEGLGVAVPWLRDPDLSSDTASTIDVVLDAVRKEAKSGLHYDLVIVLEPTAPLRKRGDIDSIIHSLTSLWISHDAIVTASPATFHPSALMRKTGDYWEQYCSNITFVERRQEGDQAFLPVGHCFAIKPEVLRAERTFYCERSTLFEVDAFQGIELDTEADFHVIDTLLRHDRRQFVGNVSYE